MTYLCSRFHSDWPVAALVACILLACGCREESTPSHWQSWINASDVHSNPTDAVEFTERFPKGTVGTQACIQCHPAEHASYLATTHSRSFRPLNNVLLSGPVGEFIHSSGRQYQVNIDAGRMIHRETVRSRTGELIAIQDGQIAYEVGSGQHAHSFLMRRDGFFVQSPLTWYAATNHWDLSPGFDPTKQATFDRSVSANCVFCHVGGIRSAGNHTERFEILEAAIGCERCHGPGAGHVDLQTALLGDHPTALEERSTTSREDIVNPARLRRDLSEAICAQCHLQGIVASTSAGSSRWAFQPGEPLSTTNTEYQLRGTGTDFRIVGHTEQLHDSKCYQQTDVLTCITCHDPHHDPAARAQPQRDFCVNCHTDDACHVPLDTRQATQQNDCVICHMPRRETNVPHAALHDHYIAVHKESFSLAALAVPSRFTRATKSIQGSDERPISLEPIVIDAILPEWQVKRRAALAMRSLSSSGQLPAAMQTEGAQATRDLLDLYREGHRDASVEVALAMDYLATGQHATATQLARDALKQSTAGSVDYLGAVDVLAQLALHAEDNAAALKWYRELTAFRRVSGDFVMLGFCENNAGDRHAAITALETALSIDPTLLFAHELIMTILAADGQQQRAEAHRRAVTLIRAEDDRLPNAPSR